MKESSNIEFPEVPVVKESNICNSFYMCIYYF